jgi:hypothetical protein
MTIKQGKEDVMTDFRAAAKSADVGGSQTLADAFAEARRTWENLAAFLPDRLAGGGTLRKEDLAELEKRVALHYEAVQTLANVTDRAWAG